MERVKHEESATQKYFNIEIAKHEQRVQQKNCGTRKKYSDTVKY